MDRSIWAQRDFSAGELDQTALRGDDTQIMRAGLRRARNVRILNTRALKRRPGRRLLFETSGIVEVIRPAVGVTWYMVFEGGQIRFKNEALTAEFVFGEMPWSSGDVTRLRFAIQGGTIIVVGGFRPRVFRYVPGTGVWENSVFGFALDQNNAVRQVYHNFYQGQGITMQPSGLIGDCTVAFSAPVLSPGHVGVVFRYVGRQIVIRSVGDPQNAEATIIEELPPTYSVAVDNVKGLQVGDVVEGVNSGARGQVTILNGPPSPGFQVILERNWNGFDLTGGVGNAGEKIAGPRSSMTIISQSQVFTTAPSTQWEEALMSDVRGWPKTVATDSQRLIFSNFPQYGAGVTWSAVGTLNDFLVGADADDAIFDYVPDNCQVLNVAGGSDEFLLTDTGIYYIPISATNPLRPGSIEFRKISEDAASSVPPAATPQGLVFVNAGATRIMAVVATGQTAAPYLVEDLTQYHAPLIQHPVAVCASPADSKTPERYVYAVNGDNGTMAVAKYEKRQNWVGWTSWDGPGRILWSSADGAQVVVTVSYAVGSGEVRYASVFDDAMLIDEAKPLADQLGGLPLLLEDGEDLDLSGGDPVSLSIYAFDFAPGLTLSVVKGAWYRGDYTVQGDGSLPDLIPVDGVEGMVGGFNFAVEVEPFVPQAGEGQARRQRMRKRRLSQVGVVVQRSQAIEVAGRLVPFWKAGENQEIPPPLRDETYRTRPLGREWDPRWSVRQSLPGALTILELATEATN